MTDMRVPVGRGEVFEEISLLGAGETWAFLGVYKG